jgi:hypothetical protein
MSSERRKKSSRANGAKSHGPTTPEGKMHSSQNALRHGMLADCVVIKGESRESFLELLQFHIDRFQPADGVEFGMMEEMASCKWRLHRAWYLEKGLFEKQLGLESGDPSTRMAGAVDYLAGGPALGLVHRYESRLHHMYQRTLRTFFMLHDRPTECPPDELPNEPSSISEHPVSGPPAPPDPPDQSPPPQQPTDSESLSSASFTLRGPLPAAAAVPAKPSTAPPAPPPGPQNSGGAY